MLRVYSLPLLTRSLYLSLFNFCETEIMVCVRRSQQTNPASIKSCGSSRRPCRSLAINSRLVQISRPNCALRFESFRSFGFESHVHHIYRHSERIKSQKLQHVSFCAQHTHSTHSSAENRIRGIEFDYYCFSVVRLLGWQPKRKQRERACVCVREKSPQRSISMWLGD